MLWNLKLLKSLLKINLFLIEKLKVIKQNRDLCLLFQFYFYILDDRNSILLFIVLAFLA